MKKLIMCLLLVLPFLSFRASGRVVNVSYYGTDLQVHFADTKPVKVKKDNAKKINKCLTWLESASSQTLKECQQVKQDMNLCDWAYVQLLDKVSVACLGKSIEQVLLMASLMDRSGYDVRVATDGTKAFGLLFYSDAEVPSFTGFPVAGKRFYAFGDAAQLGSEPSVKDVLSRTGNPVSFKMSGEQKLAETAAGAAFYNDIPDFSYDGGAVTRWSVLASRPLDKHLQQQVPDLKQMASGLTQRSAVSRLKQWVSTDADSGMRAIQLYRLVRDVLGLQMLTVSDQNGTALGICYTDDDVQGDYLVRDGMHYVIEK